MPPSSAKQHEVECKPEVKRGGQCVQAVVQPANARVVMERLSLASQPRAWLDSDRIEALPHRARHGQTRRKTVGSAVALEAPSQEGSASG